MGLAGVMGLPVTARTRRPAPVDISHALVKGADIKTVHHSV